MSVCVCVCVSVCLSVSLSHTPSFAFQLHPRLSDGGQRDTYGAAQSANFMGKY